MVLVKKKGNFYRAVIKLLGILFFSSSVHANTPRLFPVCRCPCWRRPPRKAFILRRTAPTRPGFFQSAGVFVGVDLLAKPLSFAEPRQHAPAFPRFAGAHVGVALLAKPLSFVEPRQHAPAFPDLPTPMLAPTSPQSLCPSPNRANTPWVFPICRRLCWRRPSRKAFALRRVTPTRPGFFRFAGAHVGVALLAKPLSFAEPRQHPKV